jgi:hypothetical protein
MRTAEEATVDVSLDETPQRCWTLEQLGEYCRLSEGRQAVHAWRLGWALIYAKAKQIHGDWMSWRERYCPWLSHATVNRYMKLAKSFTEEEVEGLGITTAYRKMLGNRPAKAGETVGESANSLKKIIRLPQPGGIGGGARGASEERHTDVDGIAVSGAAAESEVFNPSADDSPADSAREALLGEMRCDLPKQVQLLRDIVASILNADEELRSACWREVDANAVARDIAGLREDLAQLEADMPRQ